MEKQLKVSIPEDLRTRLKVSAAAHGITVREIVVALIRNWLKKDKAA